MVQKIFFYNLSRQILLGGDELTAARVRCAKRVHHSNSECPLNRQEGLEQLVKIHAKGELLGHDCIDKLFILLYRLHGKLYNTMPGLDAGTIYQFRNLINRRNVVKDPTDNVAACKEFFCLLTEAH